MARLLLGSPYHCPVDGARTLGATALHEAALYGHVEVARVLLEHGANCEAFRTLSGSGVGEISSPSMFMSPETGIMSSGRSTLSSSASAYGTPLLVAAERGHTDLVSLLLAHGANVDVRTEFGSSVLHRAARWGHAGSVRVLLAHLVHRERVLNRSSFDAVVTGSDGVPSPSTSASSLSSSPAPASSTAPASATQHNTATPSSTPMVGSQGGSGRWGNVGAVEEPPSTSITTTTTTAANININMSMYKTMTVEAMVNSVNGYGHTPIHVAASQGHEEVINLLLAHGARLEMVDREGRTALHEAARMGHPGTVFLLARCGSDLNAVDGRGRRPLALARRAERGAVVDLLVVGGAIDEGAEGEGRGSRAGKNGLMTTTTTTTMATLELEHDFWGGDDVDIVEAENT